MHQKAFQFFLPEQEEYQKRQENIMATLAGALSHLALLHSSNNSNTSTDKSEEPTSIEACGVGESLELQEKEEELKHELQVEEVGIKELEEVVGIK